MPSAAARFSTVTFRSRFPRPVTAEMALLFGKAFGQTPQYWINLQAADDLKMAEKVVSHRLAAMRELVHA